MTSDQTSQEILKYCRGQADQMVGLLERLANIDSASPNPAGMDEIAGILEGELRTLGFKTERVDPVLSADESWVADFFLPVIGSFDLVAKHLVGRKGGNGRGHALLLGHMDTAFPLGEPARNPFSIDGGRATGCAVMDMKGGLVNLLFALKALNATGASAPGITIVYDSDEQAGSTTARPIIERIVTEENVDWAFKAEASREGGAIRDRRPALGIALVEVEGTEVHIGSRYWDSANAITALAAKVLKLEALRDRERELMVNVGEIHGGRRRNMVAGHAYAKVDVRARSQADWNELADKIRAIAEEESLPGTTGRVRLLNHRPAMEPTEKTEALIRVVKQVSRDLGQDFMIENTKGGSDANFPAALGVPSLDGFGPFGGNTMTRDEYVEINSLPERAALLAVTLSRLASGS
jgi:glutamate carboxypeptidase